MKFRELTADEIEVRVQQTKQNGSILLLYKTARTDANILAESGVKWTNDYKTINNVLFGGIGIYDDELKDFIWKWDCGVESNTEKQKGEASDAFKRAGFKWGIGIELYSCPFLWVNHLPNEVEVSEYNGKKKYSIKTNFSVCEIGYDDKRRIDTLKIIDDDGNLRVDYRNGSLQYINKTNTNTATQTNIDKKNYAPEILAFWNNTNYDYKPIIKEYLEAVGVLKFKDLLPEAQLDLVHRLREVER